MARCFVSHETGLEGGLLVYVPPGGNETPGFPRFLSGFVSIPPPKAGAPLEILLGISPDHNSVGAMTKILIDFGVRVELHEVLVQPFAICLFSGPADSTCGAPRQEEMETNYPAKC